MVQEEFDFYSTLSNVVEIIQIPLSSIIFLSLDIISAVIKNPDRILL